MDNVKLALRKVVLGESSLETSNIKNAISADYMQSGVAIFNNDAISPFVGGKKLEPTLRLRAQEGEFGVDMENKIEKLVEDYYLIRKNDLKSQSLAYAVFEDVDGIDKTYSAYERAVIELKELDENKTFKILSDNDGGEIKYSKTGVLIVHNLESIRKLAKEYYTGEKFKENQEVVTMLATVFSLRALARGEEGDKVDDVAEQLLPYIACAIVGAGKAYIGDRQAIDVALMLAQKRIEQINTVLTSKQRIDCDISKVLFDEELFAEMNKVQNEFKDYHINFYCNGANAGLSYIKENGLLSPCSSKFSVDLYSILENVDRWILNSAIDTDEEVFESSLANLLIVEHMAGLDAEQKKQFSMAFALNMTQAMNKLGDKTCEKLSQNVFDNLLALVDTAERAKLPAERREQMQGAIDAIKIALDGYKKVKEQKKDDDKKKIVPPVKTKKPVDAIKARKALLKSFDSANKSYYGKVVNGKARVGDRDSVIKLATSIKGIVDYNGRKLYQSPADFLSEQKSTDSEKIVDLFAETYLGDYADSLVGLDDEQYKAKMAQARKEIKQFHKEHVQIPNKPTGSSKKNDDRNK